MVCDLQKASLLKRASAFLLDVILLVVLVTGIGAVMSSMLKFDTYSQAVEDRLAYYETQYGVKFEMTQEEFDKLTPTEQDRINTAYKAFTQDKDAVYNYNMVISLSMVIISLSVLLAYLVLEFAVPLLFGNGQTVGKKVFGIALMKQNGIKVNAVTLFVRTVLGKFTFETMIPLLLIVMILSGLIGIVGPLVILGILLIEVVLMITSRTNATIHDKLAQTIAVDMSSQMIFSSELEMIAYKQRRHEEMVRDQPYM